VGWLNFFGWMFDLASLLQIGANITIQMYASYHADYVLQPWHTFVTYLLILWVSTFCVIFTNRALPWMQKIGMLFVLLGGVVTIIIIAAKPKTHASSHFVWNSFDENNLTGWSGGVAFLCGVLNGAFTIGTPDAITHMAEEVPHPRRDLPKAIGLQIGLGFLCKQDPNPKRYTYIYTYMYRYMPEDVQQLTSHAHDVGLGLV
jgi:choline transport protein